MTLLVRDEIDVVESNLAYHFAQGVDFVVATDNRSRDGTLKVLERYEREGKLLLLRERSGRYLQSEWVTRMARLACTRFGADWIVNNDADEFWWPERDTLKAALAAVPASCGTVLAQRRNFLPRPDGPQRFYDRMQVRETRSYNLFGLPLPPKRCHRAAPDVVVGDGSHEVHAPGLGPAFESAGLEVLHFPERTYAQFERKVRRIGRARTRRQRELGDIGANARELYRIFRDGGLEHYYRERLETEAGIAEGLRSGRLARDERLSRFMREQTCMPEQPLPEGADTGGWAGRCGRFLQRVRRL